MKKYKLTKDGVLDTETGASIPATIKNRDYRKFLEWEKEGNKPDPIQTIAEKSKAKERKKKQLKHNIIDLIQRKNIADDEGYSDITDECSSSITKLKSELSKL